MTILGSREGRMVLRLRNMEYTAVILHPNQASGKDFLGKVPEASYGSVNLSDRKEAYEKK